MTEITRKAAALWGLETATCRFVAGRENQVFHLSDGQSAYALRIRRPGLRNQPELLSELAWMKAMGAAGLDVPNPQTSRRGNLLEIVEDHQVDLVSWMDGTPIGQSAKPLALDKPSEVFFELGAALAKLHEASDRFEPDANFTRWHWDLDGLLGPDPLWGPFWDNPELDPETASMLQAFRSNAVDHLRQISTNMDYGLIHADPVRENVLWTGKRLQLIDFDDGGFGFRLFEIATALIKNTREPNYVDLRRNLIAGYHSSRSLDVSELDFFLALRAVTYVGWITPRIHEPGGTARNARFIRDARLHCLKWLERSR
jgi:Ser/Thr protein kinase RdoA (MazF antagonist)